MVHLFTLIPFQESSGCDQEAIPERLHHDDDFAVVPLFALYRIVCPEGATARGTGIQAAGMPSRLNYPTFAHHVALLGAN